MQFRISRQSNQVVVGNAAKDLVILRVGYTDRDLLFSKMARVYNENEPFVAFRADGGSRNRQGIFVLGNPEKNLHLLEPDDRFVVGIKEALEAGRPRAEETQEEAGFRQAMKVIELFNAHDAH